MHFSNTVTLFCLLATAHTMHDALAADEDITISMKGSTLNGHQGYTRVQIDFDFSKLSDVERTRANGHFMLQLRNKGGLPVSEGTSNYDIMPTDLPVIHDGKYFGQKVWKNCIISVEASRDGKKYVTPIINDYPKEEKDGLWQARGVAVYPLKGDNAKGHRDEGANLDLDENSDLKGNVFLGFLHGMTTFHPYMRYTVESVDGSTVLRQARDVLFSIRMQGPQHQTMLFLPYLRTQQNQVCIESFPICDAFPIL